VRDAVGVRRNRRELAHQIREAVLAFPEWRTEPSERNGDILRATIGELEIIRTNAANPCFGAPATNGVDIWVGRKVFSMWWEDGDVEDDFEIVAMASGDWYAPLLSGR
jgi:hypothetical protein